MGNLGHQLAALGIFFGQLLYLRGNARGHVVKGHPEIVNLIANNRAFITPSGGWGLAHAAALEICH